MPEVAKSEVITWTDDESGHGVEVMWSSLAEDVVDLEVDGSTVSLPIEVEGIPAVVRSLNAAYTHLTGKRMRLVDDA